MREVFGRLAVAWRPAPDFSLTVAADANDGDNGLNPYTTLIDEVPGGRVFAAGYRNADISDDPYDSNTGQLDQTRVSNAARGVAATADWSVAERLGVKAIASVRRSKYEAGLDDDGFVDDFVRFPEHGEADQSSIEVQLDGGLGYVDFVAGVYLFEEDGANVQDSTVFLGVRGAFELTQQLDSTAVFASAGTELGSRWRLAGGMRTTRDRKRATTDVGTGPVSGERPWARNELGDCRPLRIRRAHGGVCDGAERLPVQAVPRSSVLPVRRSGLLHGGREHHGAQLRGRGEGAAHRWAGTETRRSSAPATTTCPTR